MTRMGAGVNHLVGFGSAMLMILAVIGWVDSHWHSRSATFQTPAVSGYVGARDGRVYTRLHSSLSDSEWSYWDQTSPLRGGRADRDAKWAEHVEYDFLGIGWKWHPATETYKISLAFLMLPYWLIVILGAFPILWYLQYLYRRRRIAREHASQPEPDASIS